MKSMKEVCRGLAIGSLVLAAGCDPPKPAPTCEMSPSIVPQGGSNGVGGTNGLNADLFHQYSLELILAMQMSLREAGMPANEKGQYPLNPKIKATFLKEGTDEGTRATIWNHVLQCAVPSTTSFTDGQHVYKWEAPDAEENEKNKVDPTKPLLATTAGWLDGFLDQSAQEDVFACLGVLLNPSYKGVPVFLTGPSVTPEFQPTPPYFFEEALWTADVNEVNGILFHVWPRITGPQIPDCANTDDVAAAFKVRVCGSSEKDCGLDVRKDKEGVECKPVVGGGDGDFECTATGSGSGTAKPALRTMLKTQCDAQALYCVLSAQ